MADLFSRFEKPLMAVAGKLGQQPQLNAIRDGVVGALPLLIIGSLFTLLSQPPLPPALVDKFEAITIHGHPLWLQNAVGSRILIGLVGIFVAFGVANSLARRYELDALSASLLAVAALLLVNGMVMATATGEVHPDKFVRMTNLGASGMFVAVLLGLLVPEVQRFVRRHKWEITLPSGVPPAVGRSFSALIPALLILLPLWALVYLGGVNLFGVINTVVAQPLNALNHGNGSFVFMLAVILLDSLLWLFGVHPIAVLSVMGGIWLNFITQNADHGTHYLNTRESMQFFIWLGGSGATIALPFLLLRARSVSLRAIAKIGVIPGLFNINEPLIFGIPVMMNAMLAIPFVLAPVVALLVTWFATHSGLVPVPSLIVPWTLPGPLGAFFATRGAWQAAVLSLVNILLATLIYWPFVRALDDKMAETEAAAG